MILKPKYIYSCVNDTKGNDNAVGNVLQPTL
jgi:hypothetical protein